MSYHGSGIYAPNEGPVDVGRIVELVKSPAGDGAVVLLDHQAGKGEALKLLREAMPDALIQIRRYVKNWTTENPVVAAHRFVEVMEAYRAWTVHGTWANEQNLAAESEGAVGAADGRLMTWAEWQRIADWNYQVAAEVRRIADWIVLHYPGMAYGHGEDWGYDRNHQPMPGFPLTESGAPRPAYEVCRAGIEICHVLNHHPYVKLYRAVLDEWEGVRRIEKTIALFPGKTIFVAETGDFDVRSPQAPQRILEIAYYLQGRPEIVGWCFFILDSPDPGHAMNNWSLAPGREIDAAYRRMTRMARPLAWSAPRPVPDPTHPEEPPVPTLEQLKAMARELAAAHRLDWPITDRQVTAESNWNPLAVSASGAKGLMQLTDATAGELGVTDPFDARRNLDGGMRFMRWLLDKYDGSYVKALVAYNWGPGNLDRLFASRPVDWRAGVSAQAARYLVKIQPPEETMAAGDDGPRARTIGAVVHSTRSGVERSLEDEAEKTAAWMRQGAPNPSCHKVISPTRALEVVPKPLAAWHARNPLNGTHLGYELAQPFAATPYHPGQYKLLARELVEDARAYGFPLVHVASGNATPGIIGHEETANGRADGKSDPGPLFDWALLQREIDALIRKPFDVVVERDTLWGIKNNLSANGWPRLAQAIEAAVTQSKGEK